MTPPVPGFAIEVTDLRKVYKGVTAVDGISFAIPVGSITGLLGGNGAGKTTTIGMILGLILPTAGAIHVLGRDMLRERHRVLHRMNFESPYVALPSRLTVRQNLRVFAQLYGVTDVERRIAELSVELELKEFLDREAGNISAGQKTRVALAKALINAPELLLLDEPTASLDAANRSVVVDLIKTRVRAGAAVIGIFHDEDVRDELADRMVDVTRFARDRAA